MLIVSPNGEIKLTRGDTAWLTVTLTDDEKQPYTMQAEDTLTLAVKITTRAKECLLRKVIKGNNVFHIKPEDTKDLIFGRYVYDVQIDTADGDSYTVIPFTCFEIMDEVG